MPCITQPMIQLFVMLLTASSSFYLVRSVLDTSAKEMAEIAAAHYDYNIDFAKNVVKQKVDTVIGISILSISLIVQMWSLSQPLRFIDADGITILQMVWVIVCFIPFAGLSEIARLHYVRKYTDRLLKDLGMNQG